jgi:UDP-N-acetylmuramoylalanine--D-glutamate ligase
VVLELSSFQLGDLLLTPMVGDDAFPRFGLRMVTNVLPDHQDYYESMETYAADKAIIFRSQQAGDWVVLSADDPYSRQYAPPLADRTIRLTSGPRAGCNGVLHDGIGELDLPEGAGRSRVEVVPADIRLVGDHQKMNLLYAATGAALLGMDAAFIRERVASFPGVPHRLELVRTLSGVDYYNDSASTIVEATLAAVGAFDRPIRLIAGGSDKGLPLQSFVRVARTVTRLELLSGSGSDRIAGELRKDGLTFGGPHDSLAEALGVARSGAVAGDVVLLSPGCASFGMFQNEFDRGDQFRDLVQNL